MVNRRASREEIEAFASDGWKFRKKLRKGILYVSRRKGRDEKGLGKYSDEYWAMIEDVIKSLADRQKPAGIVKAQPRSNEVTDPLILAMKELEHNINVHVYMQCQHKEDNDFCGFWLLEDLPRHGKQLNKKDLEYLFRKVNSIDGKTQAWAFKTTVGICSDCPRYIEGKNNKSSQFSLTRGIPRGFMPIYNP
jgi:hypothetical protein